MTAKRAHQPLSLSFKLTLTLTFTLTLGVCLTLPLSSLSHQGATRAEAAPPPNALDEGIQAEMEAEVEADHKVSSAPSASPLTLPEDQRAAWRALLEGPSKGTPLVALHYGDSHTQGAFLSRALRDQLVPLFGEQATHTKSAPHEPSPGFVHKGHPHAWGGEVSLEGFWIRQNWIYGRDQGPFGPLGISFVTQDRAAEVKLTLERPHPTQPSRVTLFYVEEPHRLGFCVRALPDPEQAERAERRAELLREASERQAGLLTPETPPSASSLAPSLAPSSTHLTSDDPPARGSTLVRSLEAPSSQLDTQPKAQSNTQPNTQPTTQGELTSPEGLCVNPSLPPKRSASQAEATLSLQTLTFELPPRHMLSVSVRGGREVRDRAIKRWRKDRAYARRKRHEPPTPPHLMYPRSPRLRVLGFHVRYPEARVEWSSLGVRGARVKSAATRSEGAIEALAQLTNPNLFVLWFGTNTAAAERVSLEAYEAQFRGLITSLKAGAPQAQCLIITPPDFGRRESSCFLSKRERRVLRRKRKNAWARQLLAERREERVCNPDALLNMRKRGRYRYPVPEARNQRTWEAYKERCQHHTPPLVSALTMVQERVAREEGCALYKSLSAMGGEGAMQRWACSSPRWAQLDLVHLSLTGYEALGAHIARSLRAHVGLDDTPPPLLTPPTAEGEP